MHNSCPPVDRHVDRSVARVSVGTYLFRLCPVRSVDNDALCKHLVTGLKPNPMWAENPRPTSDPRLASLRDACPQITLNAGDRPSPCVSHAAPQQHHPRRRAPTCPKDRFTTVIPGHQRTVAAPTGLYDRPASSSRRLLPKLAVLNREQSEGEVEHVPTAGLVCAMQ